MYYLKNNDTVEPQYNKHGYNNLLEIAKLFNEIFLPTSVFNKYTPLTNILNVMGYFHVGCNFNIVRFDCNKIKRTSHIFSEVVCSPLFAEVQFFFQVLMRW